MQLLAQRLRVTNLSYIAAQLEEIDVTIVTAQSKSKVSSLQLRSQDNTLDNVIKTPGAVPKLTELFIRRWHGDDLPILPVFPTVTV
jgi:hypothetical protein